jgi:hypothetical protein
VSDYIERLSARQRIKVAAGRRAVKAHRSVRKAAVAERAAVMARQEAVVAALRGDVLSVGEVARLSDLTTRRVRQLRSKALLAGGGDPFDSPAAARTAVRRSRTRLLRAVGAARRARESRARAVAECRSLGWKWDELHDLLGLSVSALAELLAGFEADVAAGRIPPLRPPALEEK